ncbi:MAG: hypothetical protein J3Q66DRAFT_89538 [Benniella sp.]|nr:MAG: hypothetical protein J3Q66DRAFT_89538 [Benniella sp.]
MLGLPTRVLTGLFMAPWPSFQSSQVRPMHPYSGGTFKIETHVPEEYPFEPPRCQSLTKVCHPNDQGRFCLDILKGPPKGSWNPAISCSLLEFCLPTPTQMILFSWILRVSIKRTRGRSMKRHEITKAMCITKCRHPCSASIFNGSTK